MMIMNATKFLEDIKPSDEIVVVYNNDGDGVCSCTLLKKLLKMTGKKEPYIISQPMPMDKNIIQRIHTTVPDKIIFLDIAADQQHSVVSKLSGICDILIVDHHQVFKNMNSRKTNTIVHYNPRIEEPEVYKSTSYCVYKICSKIADMTEDLWIAGVGMVSDYNLDDSKDVVRQIREKYLIEGPLYGSKLGRLADMISATRATNLLSCDQMVGVMETATYEGFENTKNADKMVESQRTIESEIAAIIMDAEEKIEQTGKIVFYNIKSRFNLGSSISTKISEKFQKNLVLIYEKSGNRIKVSARNQAKNINAGKAMQRAAKEVGGSGGGHEAAAGATIPADKWDEFKKLLIKNVNKS